MEGKTYRVNEITDLGMGGCLLPIRIKAKSGTPCELRINLGISGDEPVVLIGGEILRQKENKTAIKFVKIDPESLYHLHQIARYNSPDPDIIDKEIKKHPGIV